MKFHQLIWLLAGLLVVWPASAGDVFVASKDNTLYEDASGSLSNGAGPGLFSGFTGANGVRRALLAFDIASALPADAIIVDVELTLTMNMTISGAQDMSLHTVTADWGEGASDAGSPGGGGTTAAPGDATWLNTFYDTQLWATPGGDFNPTASATQSVAGDGDYTWGSTPEMVADVQAWLDDPDSNFGWILIGNEVDNGTAKRFGSRESVEPPQLRISWVHPPLFEVPTLSEGLLAVLAVLLVFAGVLILRRR